MLLALCAGGDPLADSLPPLDNEAVVKMVLERVPEAKILEAIASAPVSSED